MLRVLLLGVVTISLYFIFTYVASFDKPIYFLIDSLQIEMSLITFIMAFLLAQILLILVIKLIYLIFNLPRFFYFRWKRYETEKINNQLYNAIADFVLENHHESNRQIMQIYDKLEDKSREIADLIKAFCEINNEKKIALYKQLIKSHNAKSYAIKQLAKLHLLEKEYEQAEEFALKYFDYNENDPENIVTLMQVYSATKEKHKLLLLIGKLKNMDHQIWQRHADAAAECFYVTAKNLIAQHEEEEARDYLEQALAIKPDHLGCLQLLSNTSFSNSNKTALCSVLKEAFTFRPSFEIAKIYANACGANAENIEIYQQLAAATNPKAHRGTFLALAAYLDLPDKVKEMSSAK